MERKYRDRQKRHDISDFCGFLGTFTTIHVFEKWQSRATTVNKNLLRPLMEHVINRYLKTCFCLLLYANERTLLYFTLPRDHFNAEFATGNGE